MWFFYLVIRWAHVQKIKKIINGLMMTCEVGKLALDIM